MMRVRLLPLAGWVLGLATLVLAGGCSSVPFNDPARNGPFFTPVNVASEPYLQGVRRVVLLPAHVDRLGGEETALMLDKTLLATLQRENRFEVVALSRADLLRKFRRPEISSAGALPHGMLDILRQEYAADAVLFVDLTSYHAYRPLSIGLRAKLAVIDGSRILWSFDNIFSAAEASVQNAARRHYMETDQSRVPGADFSTNVLQSPAKFAGYVAATMFATLPLPAVPENTVVPR